MMTTLKDLVRQGYMQKIITILVFFQFPFDLNLYLVWNDSDISTAINIALKLVRFENKLSPKVKDSDFWGLCYNFFSLL